jgi:phage major head subunit gpT-like protein
VAKIKLLERQIAAVDKIQSNLRDTILKEARFDVSKLPWDDESLSLKKLKENVVKITNSNLREANSETVFGALLRYGVQNYMFDAYKSLTDFMYTDIVQTRTSRNRQEWYAPLYGVEIPQDVPLGGKFEDSRLAGLDVEVVNKKVGRILSFERELVDDDQTGQIAQKAQELGERMRYKEEADVLGVDVFTLATLGRGLTGVAGVSYTSTIGNKSASGFATLSQPTLETADIALMNMVDPLGNRIMVRPSILVVSPADKFNAAKLLNSTLQPSVPGTANYGSGATQSAQFQAGLTGWTMTVNPLMNLYTLRVSRFLPSGYWYLIDPRSIVFQDRDPLELMMEARDSGRSFERDEYRYRVRRRYQTAVLEYRFIFAGNGI